MAARKNSANPNGPVTRSRIKPSFFICYTLERLWPLPQPKRLRCDIVHGHQVRSGPRGQEFVLNQELLKKLCEYFSSIHKLVFYIADLTVIWQCTWGAPRVLYEVTKHHNGIVRKF